MKDYSYANSVTHFQMTWGHREELLCWWTLPKYKRLLSPTGKAQKGREDLKMNEMAKAFQKHLKIGYIQHRDQFVISLFFASTWWKKKPTMFEINYISSVHYETIFNC